MTTAVGTAAGIGNAYGVGASLISWPSNVNQDADSTTYGETPDTNVATFAPEVGPPKLRRRMSIASDTVSFNAQMTSVEYAAFLDWYRNSIADGTLPFTRTRPRTGSNETFIFVGNPPAMKSIDYGVFQVAITIKNIP